MNPAFPQNLWENIFNTRGSKVEVDNLFTFDTLADLEKTIEMNFKEGFTMGLQQLDELLSTLNNKQVKGPKTTGSLNNNLSRNG